MKNLLFFLLGFFVIILGLFYMYDRFTSNLPEPETLVPSSLIIEFSDGTPFYFPRAYWYNLEDYPEKLITALIISEDEDFFSHPGIDILGMIRGIFYTVIRKNTQGGSTLTQQLVRSLYLTQARTIERKIKEIFISLYLEKIRTKEEILELYLNSVYMGNGIYGFGTAAKYYFGKEPKNLNLAEIALLVNTVKSPENFNPQDLKGRYKRASVVLKRLLVENYISNEEYEKYSKLLNKVKSYNVFESKYDEEIFWRIIDELKEKGFTLDLLRKGFVVKTTLNRKYYNLLIENFSENNAGIIINYRTGEILAMYGKGVTNGRRQIGSLIKPFYYYKAILDGFNLDTKLFDLPIKIGDWTPKNFEKDYYGQTKLEDALIHSRNIPSVNLYLMLGDVMVRDFLKNELYINGYYPPDLTLSLGTIETSHEQIAKGFSGILTGIVVKPYIVDEVRNSKGVVVYKAKPEILNIIKSSKRYPMEASYLIIDLLRKVVNYGTGIRADIPGRTIIGKTGTAEQFAWFFGADGKLMMIISQDGRDLLGGRDVAPILRKIALKTDMGKTPFSISSVYRKLEVVKIDPLRYIDYKYLIDLIKEGKFSLEELIKILRTFDREYLIEFLSYMNTVSQEFTIRLWNMLGGGK
ncbi:glycosyl transferase [Thermosipho melanesiensis]|uniref:peptidoglycan glycosyltransferase n=2 Tax=Thermosipho melanesiensis TaxID=46541 RepID=A6LJZ7_THEM4|nr:transglycosylase domain-containing protein [Thermosipho melanesiensis]ABR30248.1 glycosyl transferase, family 51 [Thermosipho melanesiensis BI429]APT73436.1 glycosyl transferase [Thermosipho melanesiensis]OOC37379.1 glycosyl transferase [Thermosipho melanesiensis]OOC39741.1 glycosyl transferase [Thermosipho melanesiensis]OOC39846.1 glycosyl transferase [Thermosipho melanesiensis]